MEGRGWRWLGAADLVAQRAPLARAVAANASVFVDCAGLVRYQPPKSTWPVVSELDVDELALGSPFKRSRRGVYAAVGAVAVAALATAIFGVSRLGGAAPAAVNASVAAAAQPPPVPVAVTPPATPEPASTLTDAQRRELSDMDKKNQSSWEQRRKARESSGASASHYRPSASPFHKGGNRYDPLNGKL